MNDGFESGNLHEDDIKNGEEINPVFNMNKGKTLAFIGDKEANYADVFSGGEPIKMMVWITGVEYAIIYPLMLILKSETSHIQSTVVWIRAWCVTSIFSKRVDGFQKLECFASKDKGDKLKKGWSKTCTICQ